MIACEFGHAVRELIDASNERGRFALESGACDIARCHRDGKRDRGEAEHLALRRGEYGQSKTDSHEQTAKQNGRVDR